MPQPNKVVPGKKYCAQCDRLRLHQFFGKSRAQRSGFATYCLICTALSSKLVRQRERYVVLVFYGGNPPTCACCGEPHLEFLSMDHIKGGGKKHIQEIGFNLVRWLRKNGFPKGFRVLCHNCNFAHGHYGYCPHKTTSRLLRELPKRPGGYRPRNKEKA